MPASGKREEEKDQQISGGGEGSECTAQTCSLAACSAVGLIYGWNEAKGEAGWIMWRLADFVARCGGDGERLLDGCGRLRFGILSAPDRGDGAIRLSG